MSLKPINQCEKIPTWAFMSQSVLGLFKVALTLPADRISAAIVMHFAAKASNFVLIGWLVVTLFAALLAAYVLNISRDTAREYTIAGA